MKKGALCVSKFCQPLYLENFPSDFDMVREGRRRSIVSRLWDQYPFKGHQWSCPVYWIMKLRRLRWPQKYASNILCAALAVCYSEHLIS